MEKKSASGRTCQHAGRLCREICEESFLGREARGGDLNGTNQQIHPSARKPDLLTPQLSENAQLEQSAFSKQPSV